MMQARCPALAAVVAVACGTTAASKSTAGKSTVAVRPSYVRLSLAGREVGDESVRSTYDPKQGYVLFVTGDCDGSSVDLILASHPRVLSRSSDEDSSLQRWLKSNAHVKRGTLSGLRNGRGVNIGDAPREVQRKLGAPPHQVRSSGGLEWTYFAVVDTPSRRKRGPQNYRASYQFRNNRLWAIHYNLADQDSCE